MNKNKCLILIVLWISISINIFSEQLILVYSDDSYEMIIRNEKGKEMESEEGMVLKKGYSIQTYETEAEFQYEKNLSIIKIKENTHFAIEGFQTENPRSENKINLFKGKVRTIASRIKNSRYSVNLPSAVLVVRGTDFIISLDENNGDAVHVLNGKVELIDESGRSLILNKNNSLIRPTRSIPEQISKQTLSETERRSLEEEYKFTRLDPLSVPGHKEQIKKEKTSSSEFDKSSSGTEKETKANTSKEPASSQTKSKKEEGSDSEQKQSGASKKKNDKSILSRLLMKKDSLGFGLSYIPVISSDVHDVSDGGKNLGIDYSRGIEMKVAAYCGLRTSVTIDFAADDIRSCLMIPTGFFTGFKYPLINEVYIGAEAEAGLQYVMINLEDSSSLISGFNSYGYVYATLSKEFGPFIWELKAGAGGFNDREFILATPIGLSMKWRTNL